MPLDAQEMKEVETLLAPGSGITDDERTRLLELRNSYQDEHLSRAMPAPQQTDTGEQALPLIPSLSLLPQLLSAQPATTHPAGDRAAENEWIRSGGKDAKNAVFVYDVPLAVAKKDLLEHPEKLRALYPNIIEHDPNAFTPESIMAMDHDSELYDDYQNRVWLDTADAAAAAGKTAYRYSKAPYLHKDGAGSVLPNLKLKLEGAVQPYGEGVTAFVMGVDDINAIGAGQAAARVAGADMTPLNPLGSERVGGVTASDPTERFAQLREEHPALHFGGQALGMLSGWGPVAWGFGQIMRGGKGAAALMGGSLPARVAAGTAAGSLGAAAMQAGSDAIEMGADTLTGTEGIQPEDMPGRAAHAAAVGAPFALAGAGASELASKRVNDIKWGNRYNGAPGQLGEDLGRDIKFSAISGPKSPALEELKVRGRKARAEPGDLIARDIAKPIASVLDQDVKGVLEHVSETRERFIRSPEGKAPLPVKNFLEATTKELRADMQASGRQGVPKVVGKRGSGDDLVDLFNTQVDTVSLEPVEGAVALSPEEAQAFLGRNFHRDLLRAKPVKAPPGGPRAPFSPADDLPKAPRIEQRPLGVGEPSPPPHLPVTKPGAGDWRSPRPIDAGEPIRPTPQAPVGGYEYHRQTTPEAATPGSAPLRGNREPALGGPPQPTPELTLAEKKVMGRLGNMREAPRAEDPAVASALDKTRVERPPTLYKGMRLDANEAVKKGEITFDNYSSAGADKSYAAGYAHTNKGDVLLEFEGLPAAHMKSDREMLVPPGGYEVTGRRSEKVRIPELDRDIETTVLTVRARGGAGGATEGRGPRSAEAREKLPRGKSLADTLRKRGVETVYVVPRSYDAEHTETLLDKIAAVQKKGDRDLAKLDKAARFDRDARSLNGEAGGWSKLQNQHSELIEKAKLAEQLGAPGGESFKVLSGYHKQKHGDLVRADVLRDAASRAGVREQLDRLRSLEPYEQLRHQSNFESMASDPHRGHVKRIGDFATIRSLPFWSALEGPLGPLSAGQAGRAAMLGRDEDEKERRKRALQKEAGK